MHEVNNFLRRQEGLSTSRDYDFCIKRLVCYEKDRFSSFHEFYNASPVFAARFGIGDKYKHIVALGNEDGWVTLIDTNHWDSSKNCVRICDCASVGTVLCDCVVGHLQCHNNTIFEVAWSPQDMRLVTASGDHTAVLWDLGPGQGVPLAHFRAHSRSVKTAQFRPDDNNVIATGARDGNINIWDVRSFRRSDDVRPDNFITHAHSIMVPAQTSSAGKKSKLPNTSSSRASSITCLTFQDEFALISCGAGDGCIKVWDLRKNYCAYQGYPIPVHNMKHSSNVGFTSLVLDPGKVRLYASCLNGPIFCYNVVTYSAEPVAEYTGASIGSYYVKSCLSPDGRYLLSGSSDCMAYVWNTGCPGEPLVALVRNNNEVTCVAWNPCHTQVITCSDDPCFQFWEVGPEDKNECGELSTELCGWADVRESPRTPLTTRARRHRDTEKRWSPSPVPRQPPGRVPCPTSNLPNSVLDGRFHLHRCQVGRDRGVNWLVQINSKAFRGEPRPPAKARRLLAYPPPLRSGTASILPYLVAPGAVGRPSAAGPAASSALPRPTTAR